MALILWRRGRKVGACYRQTRHSINLLRAVIIILGLFTWFYIILLVVFLLTTGPLYCEVTRFNSSLVVVVDLVAYRIRPRA